MSGDYPKRGFKGSGIAFLWGMKNYAGKREIARGITRYAAFCPNQAASGNGNASVPEDIVDPIGRLRVGGAL